ncbi:putative restriction endonuclease [Methanocella conradii HZ254]|uniref:Restriction endonuclease n=1 Tax=Methanocella conradii (strain DSM 24694 / JCM 17849 / CGMCC 1.5162 / HZ254) TaxID=1041930 RepID=H8I438_METCZ|nr:DUF3427 domain-containing protein [Methanocella conradii]AFC99177.1 putative restriction endonuclease [Methanocella conradii HZ254]
MYASNYLTEGEVYTRNDLRRIFNINDATINNGVFKPRGYKSIWLFITEKKSIDRTQYIDYLECNTLRWDGQTSGRTDNWIIDHKKNDDEILVFYRKTKNQYNNYGFKYEGKFEYESCSSQYPRHFILKKIDDLAYVDDDLEAIIAEETYTEGERTTVLANKYERNSKLRKEAIRIHGTTCMVCGLSFGKAYGKHGEGYIEVHHIKPLSTYDAPVEINPKTDMVVLCSNCHRMVHRYKERPLSIDELKHLIKK